MTTKQLSVIEKVLAIANHALWHLHQNATDEERRLSDLLYRYASLDKSPVSSRELARSQLYKTKPPKPYYQRGRY